MAENSTHRKIEHSAEEKARDKAVRDQLRNHPTPEELVASKEFSEPIPQAVVLDAMALLAQLRESREVANLTLAALAERTGIDKPALSRLETGRQNNPTLQTILRYVHGLGKRIVWSIVDDAETSNSVDTERKTANPSISLPPMEDATIQQSAKSFVEWLLYAQARVAASLAEGYKEPARFMFEQTLGRGNRFDTNVWLQPEIQRRLIHSDQTPSACPAPLLTVDCEGRLAFLCSSLPITPHLPLNPMREKLLRALNERGGRIEESCQEGGLDDCFFCMEMKPGTKFIPLKDIPLPGGSNVPPAYALSKFCICPECDAKPYEWKEARMLWHIKNHYQMQQMMQELFEKYEQPLRVHQRSDGFWIVLDAKGREVEGLSYQDRDQVDAFLQALATWQQEAKDIGISPGTVKDSESPTRTKDPQERASWPVDRTSFSVHETDGGQPMSEIRTPRPTPDIPVPQQTLDVLVPSRLAPEPPPIAAMFEKKNTFVRKTKIQGSVGDHARKLGMNVPTGICLLPSNFFGADDVSKLTYASSVLDAKISFRKEGITLDNLAPDGTSIHFHSQHDAQWIGPIIFFGAAVLSHDPNVVTVALGVISNLVTNCFKGKLGDPQMTLGIVVEKTEVSEKEGKVERSEKKETVQINYSGPVRSFKAECEKAVRDALK